MSLRRLLRPLPGAPVLLATAALAACAGAPPAARAQAAELERCAAAERFLAGDVGMVAAVTADTVDDWRTRRRVAGCRVTAAGSTMRPMAVEAPAFYDRLRAAGWTRTPDPMDAPNESSLRFRAGNTDCLFNVYAGILVGTTEELEVNARLEVPPGASRYNVLVQCIPAMEAGPRGGAGAGSSRGRG